MCCEKDSLWQNEFIRPITDIITQQNLKFDVLHFSQINEKITEKYTHIILSGAPLKDFEYLKHINKFNWLKKTKNFVLGICAGFQIIANVFAEEVIDYQEIGLNKVKTTTKNPLLKEEFEVYELHNKGIKTSKNFTILAKSKNCIQAIQKDNIYATIFHPEVRNKNIIINFLNLK